MVRNCQNYGQYFFFVKEYKLWDSEYCNRTVSLTQSLWPVLIRAAFFFFFFYWVIRLWLLLHYFLLMFWMLRKIVLLLYFLCVFPYQEIVMFPIKGWIFLSISFSVGWDILNLYYFSVNFWWKDRALVTEITLCLTYQCQELKQEQTVN